MTPDLSDRGSGSRIDARIDEEELEQVAIDMLLQDVVEAFHGTVTAGARSGDGAKMTVRLPLAG